MQVSIYSFIVRRLLLTGTFLVVLIQLTRAQEEFVSAGVLYQDPSVKVELEYKIIPCSQNKTSKFRYRVTGRPANIFINWKMAYYNCNEGITYQTNSLDLSSIPRNAKDHIRQDIDWSFSGIKMYRPFYEVRTQTFEDHTPATTGPIPPSVPAVRIIGKQLIEAGEKITLRQEGGKLAEDAQWHWYANSCEGQPLGTGESITVAPLKNTVYYVRAQWFDGSTDCASMLVKINTGNAAADAIDGKTSFCRGSSEAPLKVVGGKLIKGARWVWYADSVATKPVAIGPTLNIAPRRTTRYFVRAENTEDDVTDSRSITVQVVDGKPEPPEGISAPAEVCIGNLAELSVIGGKLTPGGEWVWYHDAVSSANLVAKGSNFSTKLASSAVFLVQGENGCGVTEPKSVHITANTLSVAPDSIAVTNGGGRFMGQKLKLEVHGGALGTQSRWVWYKNACGTGDSIGTGESIKVKASQSRDYFVRAQGPCNNTACTMHHVTATNESIFFNLGMVVAFRAPGTTSTSTVTAKSGFSKAISQGSVGLTIGKIKNSLGWYGRIKYSFNSKKSGYTTAGDSLTDYKSASNYYVYNGETQEARLAVTGGVLVNLAKNVLLFNAGIGYGKRTLSWGISEYSYQSGLVQGQQWAKNNIYSFAGPELELGLMVKWQRFNFMLGGNFIFDVSGNKEANQTKQNLFSDMYAGIGLNF